MEERQLFFGDDGYEIGSEFYVVETNNPGYWSLIFTGVVCFFVTCLLPVCVIMGQRYEKRRIKAQSERNATEAAEATTGQVPEMSQLQRINSGKVGFAPQNTVADIENSRKGPEVSFMPGHGSIHSSPNKKNNRHRRTKSKEDHSVATGMSSTYSRKGKRNTRSTMSAATGVSAATSYVHTKEPSNISGNGNFMSRAIDKVVMPPYQDDEAKSVLSSVSRYTGMTNASGATGLSAAFLDTRNRRRRGHGLANNTAAQRERRRKKQSQREDIVSPSNPDDARSYVRGPRGWSDTKSDVIGNGISSNQTVGSDLISARSQMTGRNARFARGRQRMRGGSSVGGRPRSRSPGTIVSHANSMMSKASMMSKIVDDISPNDAADANDPGQMILHDEEDEEYHICCGKNAIWRPAIIMRAFDVIIDLAQPDNESRRIVKLAIPFTVGVVMEAIFDNIELAFVGHFIGTDALAAYAMVDLLVGTTAEFIEGLYDAAMTVCPHAIGVGNNYLAGQYIQQCLFLYTFASIPFGFLWWYKMYDAIMWFGFPENIAQMGQDMTKIVLFADFVDVVHEIYHGLLEVTDHEGFSAIMGIVEGCVTTLVVGFLFFYYDLDLVDLQWINIFLGTLFFIITLIISLCKGWVKDYLPGMVGNFAMKNTRAFKVLLNTAIPLSLGSLIAYGEWELLTVFISYLGAAEVAAWSVLGSIWETFEAATEGIGDAAEVRVAYHLGKANPEMAYISAQKSILVGVLFSCFITSIFFIIGENLAGFFTTDEVLQYMVNDAVPLIGLGNITMTYGMVCWAIIGAQGRYRLATLTAFIASWFVTVPMAALSTYVFYFDLKGVTASVVIGYQVAGVCMTYIVLRSDWERLSKIVVELNRVTGEVESSDSEGYSSSSSSSDDSDSDSDSDSD